MRTLTFTLGAILTAYCFAGALSETTWQNSEPVNRVLCRFLLCNNAPLVWSARAELSQGTPEHIQHAIDTFREVLRRDPQDPYRWADLGDAFVKAGQIDEARYCFQQVLDLAPRTASFLLRAADFHWQIGETELALPITARILSLIPDYDSIVFGRYARLSERTEDVLRLGLPEDSRAAKSWLKFLIQNKRVADAQLTWGWISARGTADDALAGQYSGFLIEQGHPDLAASAWAQYLGARADDYKSTAIFNGGFESDPAPSPFDWNFHGNAGAEVTRDCANASSGKCSLRIAFAGTENLDFAAASQLAFVRPGAYRFRAFVHTDSVTTDEGIRFRVSDADAPARMNEVFGQFTGNVPWTGVERVLVVPPQTNLLRIEVIRQPSLKFDNKVGGTAWIDELKLEPIPSSSPR